MSVNHHDNPDLPDRLLVTAQSTREDVSTSLLTPCFIPLIPLDKVDSVRRVVKRIKLEVTTLKASFTSDDDALDSESDFPASRSVLPRSPHTRHMSVRQEVTSS